ncbi:hypothetical protein [Amycolatopsis sp. NPDC098790]|uniref:hypothetical protein n=1 Tax=Amycolatopsis sp. NPDC098790 TaxID=3363939 RepID=UPI00381C2C6A
MTTNLDNSTNAPWRHQAAWARHAYERRADLDWWRTNAPEDPRSLQARSWAYALLAFAKHTAVVATAADLDRVLDSLAPHQFAAIKMGFTRHLSRGGRRLSLRDELRLGKVSVRGRTATLLSVITHDSTREQLAKIIQQELPALLRDGLLAPASAENSAESISIKIDGIHGVRQLDLEGVALAGLTDAKAGRVLAAPHEWPPAVVQAAAQRLSQKAAQARSPLAVTAEENRWFPDVPWRHSDDR